VLRADLEQYCERNGWLQNESYRENYSKTTPRSSEPIALTTEISSSSLLMLSSLALCLARMLQNKVFEGASIQQRLFFFALWSSNRVDRHDHPAECVVASESIERDRNHVTDLEVR